MGGHVGAPHSHNVQTWRIVAVAWVTLAVAYGIFFSFSVFFVPLLEEFHWSRALIAGAFSLSSVVQGMCSPVAGVVLDRVGPRPVIIGAVVLLGASSMLLATTSTPWELYLYSGVMGGVALVGLGWVPMGVLLSAWVRERRGRIAGIAFSGMGVGVFVVGPLAQWLISNAGWRVATVTIGAGAMLVLLPITWVGVRNPPHEPRTDGAVAPRTPPRGATVRDALGSSSFWLLFVAYLMTPLAVFPIFTHQVAYAVDLGFPRLFVATVFGAMGLMSSAGRIGFGLLTDRFGGPVAAALSFACTAGGAVALVVLEFVPVRPWLLLYAGLFGLGFGARGPIITAMATERYAGRRFGVIYGVLNVANGVGAAIGPWFGGWVHDVTASYRIAFMSSVVFSAAGAACFWLSARRAP